MKKSAAAVIIVFTAIVSFLLGWSINCGQPLVKAEDMPEEKAVTTIDSFDLKYPEYQVYGMRQEKDRHRYIASSLYNFRFRIVGGCTVDEETIIEAGRQNQKTDKIMTARYGQDWYRKFERSVDSLYSLDSLAVEIAKQSREYRIIQADSGRIFNLEHIAYPTHKDNIKVVSILGDEDTHPGGITYDYLRVSVDIRKQKILTVDKQAYERRY